MDPLVDWVSAPAELSIAHRELHIWRARLDVSPVSLERLAAVVSPEEVRRAQRFRFARQEREHIAGRGLLRLFLGRYLRRPASSIVILNGPYDKPYLSQKEGDQLQFNLSHSHGVALFAFALGGEVGIDLEKVQSDFATDRVAERFFSACERAELRSLPAEVRTEAFFHCWTRKEAYVKANGNGLRVPLDGFDVTVTPGQPAKVRSDDSSRWSLFSFLPAPGFVAAAVAEGNGWKLQFFEWTESSL